MKKIIIIGAGPAGITAGYELLQKSQNYKVIILEESEMIGGISRTVNYKGNRMDIGGHRFFSKDTKVTDWWENIMPLQGAPAYDDKILNRTVNFKGSIDPEKEDKVLLTRNRVSRIYYHKKFFDYPVKLNWNTLKNMGFITTLNAGISYLLSVVYKKPETSLENFYINRFGQKLYSMFFESYTEKLWGRHPREISADWGAQRVKGLSIIAILKDILAKLCYGNKNVKGTETSLIEEFIYPKYGPGQLWETAALEFEKMGGVIHKNCKVVNIKTSAEYVSDITYLNNGNEITESADILISSMPLKDLICGMNNVPENIASIAQGLPYRDFITMGLLINHMNIKNQTQLKTLNNIVPDCWIYVQDEGMKLGRIQIFNNWSPYMVADPDKTVWIGLEYFCQENDEFWNMNEEDCIKFGISELIKMDIISSETNVIDYHHERVKKAYPAYFDSYSEIDTLINYINKFKNLYCIGRNGQHRYNNMDHSMVTAFETVKNILTGQEDKANIWNVNTEKEYHEEKGH